MFDGPAQVPPIVALGFLFKITPSPTLVGIPVQEAPFLLRGLGTFRVLGLLEQTVSGGPARVLPTAAWGFCIFLK